MPCTLCTLDVSTTTCVCMRSEVEDDRDAVDADELGGVDIAAGDGVLVTVGAVSEMLWRWYKMEIYH
jgi:hypothetical protein